MTRFSVIIPAYRARFLAEAVASVLVQDFPDFELIVFDDASPEDLSGVMSNFRDPRIVYRCAERNLGAADPSRTWNAALALAKSEFVTLLGDDDLLDANYLREMDALVGRQPNCDIYRCRLRLVDEAGATISLGFPLPERESWDEFLYFRNAGKRPHSTAEMCLRTSALRSLGGWLAMPAAIGSDDLTYLELAARTGIASTNATWASWRTHRRQLSTSRRMEATRVEAVRRLGEAERLFLSRGLPGTIEVRLLEQSLPGQGRRSLAERARSWMATFVGKIGFQ